MQNKYFTLTEANLTLPYVSLIINDIVYKRKEMIKLKEKQTKLMNILTLELKPVIMSISKEIKALSRSIAYHLDELEQVGCYLKDFELGLVEFPSVINNKVVFLTYQYGEKEINYWHYLTEGVEQRKLINLDKNLDKISIFN